MEKDCLFCKELFKGKKDRKFCSSRCFGFFNREKVIERNESRRKYHKIPGLTRQQIFRYFNPKQVEKELNRDKDKRLYLIAFLGGKCIKCGYNEDKRALQLDHIQGDGYLDRKQKGRTKIYRFYMKNLEEATKKLQVLCANCNKIKQIEEDEFRLHIKTKTLKKMH